MSNHVTARSRQCLILTELRLFSLNPEHYRNGQPAYSLRNRPKGCRSST